MQRKRMLIFSLNLGSGLGCRFLLLLVRRVRWRGIDNLIARLGLFFCYFVADALFLLLEFGSEERSEVFGFEDGTDFDYVARREWAAFQPFDCFFDGANLPEPEAADEFFGFGEGAVGDGGFFGGEGDALALGGGLEAFSCEQDACFGQLFVELTHFSEQFGAG